MALLSFPSPAVNGQLYPATPVAGQNQYQWETATNTWRLLGAATGVIPGVYGDVNNIPQITVDATGRITVATNIAIGANYVKTNNTSAYNNYVWPNADGGASDILTTDGSGNLAWQSFPFTNYWQLIGSTLLPATPGQTLAITDSGSNFTFVTDPATKETEFLDGTTAVVVTPNAAGVSTIAVSGAGSLAQPLGLLGSDFSVSAYGNSYLNTPSNLTFTQSLFSVSTPISTDAALTVNAGTANSFSTPPSRGTSGQILVTNGDGTTSWVTNPEQGWWARSGSNLYPENNGDNVQIRSLANIPVIELNSDGTASFIKGNQSLFITPQDITGNVELKVINLPGAGSLNVDANSVNLRAFGGAYTNPPTQFLLNHTQGITFDADISGTRRNLLTANLDGDFEVGYNIDFGAPALSVDGLLGNTRVGGILTVNNGVGPGPTPGPNSYAFPNNRGIAGYVLMTNADGSTKWENVALLSGYWTQSLSGLDLYPTQAGQNVFIRDSASNNAIELFAAGYIVAYGGDVNDPTYAVANNGTGMYGTNSELDFAVNGLQVAKIDQNYFYSYGEIQMEGVATNPGTTAVFENDNAALRFVASSDPLVLKNIEFEIGENIQAGFFNNTGDFAVVQGNASVGSANIVTYIDSTTLAVGSASANQGGLFKYVSAFNGGDGVETYQDEATGDWNLRMDHTATPVVTVNATDINLDTNLDVAGDTTLNGNLFYPAPTVPPASASPGTPGQIAWDANYIYVCVALNTWKRSPLATW